MTNKRAYSRLSCVSTKKQTVYCFYRGRDPSVEQFKYNKNGLSNWKSIGGNPYKNVQCVSSGDEKIDCFYIDPNNIASYASYRNKTWSDWSNFPGNKEQNEVGRSSCVAIEDELSGCLFRNLNDIPEWYTVSNGTVKKEQLFTHTYHSPFSCLIAENGTIFCYGECNDDCLCALTYNGTDWSGRNPIQCPKHKISSEPTTALALGNHTHHVFSRDLNERMVHTMHDKGTEYTPFEVIEEKPLIESPECILHREDNVHCFAIGYNHALYQTHFNGTKWTHYRQIGDDVSESPSCVAFSKIKILCFTRNTRGYIIRIIVRLRKRMPFADDEEGKRR